MKMIEQINRNKVNFTSQEYKILMESFEFIQHHPDITNDQLPDQYLKSWSVPDFIISPYYKRNDLPILVFMYILKLHFHSSRKVEKFLNSFQFNQLFYNFQIILFATAHSRQKNVTLKAFPLFHIEKYLLPDLRNPKELIKQYQDITSSSLNK